MNNSLEIIAKLEELALSSQVDVEIEDTNADSFVAGLHRMEDDSDGSWVKDHTVDSPPHELWGYNDRLGLVIEELIHKGIDEFSLNPYLALDLGCGVGNFLRDVSEIEGVKAFGIDRYLRNYDGEFMIPRENFIVGDFAHPNGIIGNKFVNYFMDEIPDESFHLIVASRSNKFESKYYPQYLNQIARILAPKGIALIELACVGPGKFLKEKDLDEFRSNYKEHVGVKPSSINSEELSVLEIGKY